MKKEIFEKALEKQLGPGWQSQITTEALEFYRVLFETGYSAGWVAHEQHSEHVRAMKRLVKLKKD